MPARRVRAWLLPLAVALMRLPPLQAAPPHVILIVADDLGYNDVPWHNRLVRAPTLARLAAAGARLEQAYVQPVCTPSRAALLTGRYPFRLGRQHEVLWPLQPTGLTLNATLLPRRLRRAGYRTHAVGKWHLGFCARRYTPTARGFQSFLGFWTGSEHYYAHTRSLDNSTWGYDFRRNMSVARSFAGRYSADVFAEEAERVIDDHPAARPLFLYLAFQSVHAPLQVPRRYWDLYPGVRDADRRTYLGMVSALDDAVARVEAALRRRGLLDNSVIIFTTDNGGQVLAGGNNYPLRGNKVTLWEGGTRAASFVHSALLQRRGYVSRALIHVTDWYPTVLRLAGVRPAAEDALLDGVDQWDVLSRGLPSRRHHMVYNIDVEQRLSAAVRVGDWKLIWGFPGDKSGWYPEPGATDFWPLAGHELSRTRYRLQPGATDVWPLAERELSRTRYRLHEERDWTGGDNATWLFDLAADPTERRDLSRQRPDLVAALQHVILRQLQRLVPADCPADDNRGSPNRFGHVYATDWC